MAAEDKNTASKSNFYLDSLEERLPRYMVDFVGEIVFYLLDLLIMLWPPRFECPLS